MSTKKVAVSKAYTNFTVVIPTRHRNGDLAECLARLAPGMQSFEATRYEVIVTDDGYNTTSEELVAQRFPWARWTQGPRLGPAANRNHGASLAKSNWIAFTDDDCLPDPGWLEAFAQASCNEALVLEGRTVCREGLGSPIYEAPVNESGGNLWSCNLALRSDVFHCIGGFDERFPYAAKEDDVFRDSLRRHNYVAEFVPHAVVDHPPRRCPFGAGWNKRWQSQILKERVLDAPCMSGPMMPFRVAKIRCTQAAQSGSISDLVLLLTSTVLEVANVALHQRSWSRWADGVVAPNPTCDGRD